MTTAQAGRELVSSYRPAHRVDLVRTLAPLRRGTADPTYCVEPGGVWLTALLPDGPATLRLEPCPDGGVEARAWGPGAEQALAAVPDLLGARDRPEDFTPTHRGLHEAARRLAGMRVPRTGRVFETLVPAVLEQKVTGVEARRAWRWLLRRYGLPAPGPGPAHLRVVPPAAVWRRVPSWDWHAAGVDAKRSRTVISAALVAEALERTVGLAAAEARRRLELVPGIGVWTSAEVAQRAYGDADAVSVGDYHLSHLVGCALAGYRVDDAGMLELLAPYAPHRYRVVRLLESAAAPMPRFGPRLAPRDFSRM